MRAKGVLPERDEEAIEHYSTLEFHIETRLAAGSRSLNLPADCYTRNIWMVARRGVRDAVTECSEL